LLQVEHSSFIIFTNLLLDYINYVLTVPINALTQTFSSQFMMLWNHIFFDIWPPPTINLRECLPHKIISQNPFKFGSKRKPGMDGITTLISDLGIHKFIINYPRGLCWSDEYFFIFNQKSQIRFPCDIELSLLESVIPIMWNFFKANTNFIGFQCRYQTSMETKKMSF